MTKNPKSNESTLHPNTKKADSLRTTIPKFIIDQFKLSKGDRLVWIIDDTKKQYLKVQIPDGGGT